MEGRNCFVQFSQLGLAKMEQAAGPGSQTPGGITMLYGRDP